MSNTIKNTVLLIRNAAPNDFGGAETYPVSLAKILIEKEWHPVIVSESNKLIDYATNNDIETIKGKWLHKQNFTGRKTAHIPFYIGWQIYLTFWYIGIIRKTKARTLHIQSRDDFIAASIAGRILSKKVIWTDHMDLRYVFENITKPGRNLVGKLVYWATRFAHTIILISDNEYRLVTAQFKKPDALNDKVKIIKNGVVDHLKETPRVVHDDFIFSTVSRVVRNKGIGEVIDAFNRLPNTVAAKLHIYGDGKDLEIFKRQAASNKSIVFFGHTNNSLQAIRQADVFILPSYQEGFSIALLESTMLGSAIIATDVDSNREIIDDGITGLLIPSHDAHSLSLAMLKLYKDKALRNTLSNGARKKYEQQFNLVTKVEKEILPLY